MARMRFSLLALVGTVLLIGLGLGALRAASEPVSRITLSTSILALCFLLLGACWSESRSTRMFCSGFSLFGSMYLILTLVPSLDAIGQNLISTTLIDALRGSFARPMMVPPDALDPFHVVVWVRRDGSVWLDGQLVDLSQTNSIQTLLQSKSDVDIYVEPGAESLGDKVRETVQAQALNPRRGMPLSIYFRPAKQFASQEAFHRTAHSIFALLFGIGGGLTARLCWGGSKQMSKSVDRTRCTIDSDTGSGAR